MGGQSSEIERECQRKADDIREDLHRRVDAFRSQHQGQFDGISQ